MILKNINTRKATGPGKFLAEVTKFTAKVIGSHLTNIINQ